VRAGALALAAALSVAALGCGDGERRPEKAPAYARPETPAYARGAAGPEVPAVAFVDVTAASGLHFEHETGAFGRRWMPETMGSGAAFVDWDGDGDDDALLVTGAPWPGHAGTAHCRPAPCSPTAATAPSGR